MKFIFCMPGRDILLTEQERSGKNMAFYYERCREVTYNLGLEAFESNVGTLMTLSDEEIDYLAKKYPRGGLGLYAVNGFLAGMPNIVTANGEEKNTVLAHIAKTVSRLEKLGAKIIVFGSGWNRKIPEDADFGKAEETICAYIKYAASLCEKAGLTLVLEPLNRSETNWCNSVKAGAETVRKLSLPSFRLLADGYHMARENEDLEVIEKNGDILRHCHIASENRRAPGSTQYEKDFLSALKKIGYDGAVSVECRYSDFFAEAPRALEFMKKTVS